VLVEWLTRQNIVGIESKSVGLLSLAGKTNTPAKPKPWLWLPPGAIFFAGGLTVLLGVLLWSTVQSE